MYTYKNVSEQDQIVIGHGEVEAGSTIESETEIENPNFELVATPTPAITELPPPPATPQLPEINEPEVH